MRRTIMASLLAAGAVLAASVAPSVQAHDVELDPPVVPPDEHDPVLVEGGVMAGSTNGMSFAPDGSLWVANVLGATITQIDPDTGEILSRLTAAESVLFPDDVVVADDGTIYWTEIGLSTVYKRPPGGPSEALLPFGGLNSANPLTLSDDGRLFAAGCYGGPPGNSFVELDPVNGGILNTLFGPVPDCASNSMSWGDGVLYSPQPFLGEVWEVDPDTGAHTPVTTNWPVPIGTAVDSNGDLYALAQGVGEVVRIDVDDTDTDNNRTVIADIPVGWADNIAISDDDRIFISSASDSTVVEVLAGGALRTVVPGQFELANGVAVIGNTLYTVNFGGVWGFDRSTGAQTSVFRAAFGVSVYPPTSSVVAWRKNLVVMSIFGPIAVWNPRTNTPRAFGFLNAPIDAQPFRGDLIVTQSTGEIVRVDRNLTPIEVVANVPGATGLAKQRGDVFVANQVDGTVLRIIDDDVALATPEVVVSGLDGPEGIDIRGGRLFVVEGATETVTQIKLKSGAEETIGTDLGFMDPTPLSAFGWFNDVKAKGRDVYVNADRANVLYEFHLS